MSQEVTLEQPTEKITSEVKPPKPKDPKRVEAGKKLPEMSKRART